MEICRGLLGKRGLFRLRKASLQDIDILLRIERKSHAHPWGEEGFRQEIEPLNPVRHQWVLVSRERPGKIVAYICFHYLLGELYVLNLTVDAFYRRMGLGECLMRLAIFWAKKRGCRQVVLEVDEKNIPARRLYEKLGFGYKGHFEGPGGGRQFRMRKSLLSY